MRAAVKKKIFSAAWVLPISHPPISDGAIVVDEDRIFDIGPEKELLKKYSSLNHKKFRNAVLLPGFVNTHCHLVHAAAPTAPRDFAAWYAQMVQKAVTANPTEKEFKQTAQKGAQELIHSGVTTVADSGPSPVAIPVLKKSGLRAIFYQEIFGFAEKEPATLIDRLREQLAAGQKKLPARIHLGLAPHSPYTMPTKLFHELSRFCQKEKIPMTTHVAESYDELLFFKNGDGALSQIFPGRNKLLPRSRSSVEYLSSHQILSAPLLAAHCVHVDQGDRALMKKNRTAVAYCPTSNYFLNVGAAPVAKFLESKIPVGLGTDSAATSGSLNFFQTLRDAALLGNLSAEQVLKLATLEGAKAIGLAKEIGSLEKEKKADFIAIDLKQTSFANPISLYHHLVWNSQPSDLIFSIIDGQKQISK